MERGNLFKIIEVVLLDHGVDPDEAGELTDSILERLEEEGAFDVESTDYDI